MADQRTHIRAERDNSRSLCGIVKPNESISFQHYHAAMSPEDDIVFVHDSNRTSRVPVDRKAAIRYGIETLPHQICHGCSSEYFLVKQ